MSRIRSTRVPDGGAVDEFSSSLIFGSAQKSPSMTQQQTTTPSGYYGEQPFLLDGSGGTKRSSPGGSLRPSPGMVPYGTDTMTPGRSPNRQPQPGSLGPPVHSMLERHGYGHDTASGAAGPSAYSHSPLFGRSPAPLVPTAGGGGSQQSPFFGGGAGRPTTALGMGWSSSSSNGNGHSEGFVAASSVAGSSSSSAGNGTNASGLCYEDLEAMWRVWVIVSGFPSSSSSSESVQVLLQLQRYGDVVDHVAGRGNWLFVKFSSPYEAERAATECPLMPIGGGGSSATTTGTGGLGAGAGGGGGLLMLTVTRLTADLARTLDFHLTTAHPKTTDPTSSMTSTMPSTSVSRQPTLVPCDDAEYSEKSGLARRRGQDIMSGGISIGVAGPRAQALTARADPHLMAQYLRPIKRDKSICERIMDYFFA